jgi:hypothetical protein
MDSEGDEAQEAVVEGAQCGIRAAFAGLYLEEPDGDVDGDAQRPARLFELGNGELRQGDALPGPDLLVDAATVSICV